MPFILQTERFIQRGFTRNCIAGAEPVEDRLIIEPTQTVGHESDPDHARERIGIYCAEIMGQIDRGRSVYDPSLIVVELNSVLGVGFIGGEGEDRVNSRDRDRSHLGDGTCEEGTTSDKEEPQVRRGEVQRDAEVAKGGDDMAVGAGAMIRRSGSGDGEIGVEDLVEEGGVGEAGRVAQGEGREGRLDEVRVDVLGDVAAFEGKVLEEGIGGQGSGQEVRREEEGRVGKDC